MKRKEKKSITMSYRLMTCRKSILYSSASPLTQNGSNNGRENCNFTWTKLRRIRNTNRFPTKETTLNQSLMNSSTSYISLLPYFTSEHQS